MVYKMEMNEEEFKKFIAAILLESLCVTYLKR